MSRIKTAALVATCVVLAGRAHADVTISTGTTQNMTCSAGVCAPTAPDAVLNVSDLQNLLASDNVKVTTAGAGVQANNVELDAVLSWSATSTLTLDAHRSIMIGKAVTVAGSGGLMIITNDGGKNGTFSFGPKGRVDFQNLASPLTIDGVSFMLVNSLPSLAAAVVANPAGAYALANSYDSSKDGTYYRCPMNTLDGSIEGLGNTISRLSIYMQDGNKNEGMVDTVSTGALIENLRLSGISYQAYSNSSNGAGGLAGTNDGTLLGDTSSGTLVLTGNPQAGGIAGWNNGTIVNNSATVSVSGDGCSCGGLAGWNTGTIELSRAVGTVSGYLAGGFVGQNEGPISQSFSTGSVDGTWAGGFVSNNTPSGPNYGTIEDSYATGNLSGSNIGGFVSTVDLEDTPISDSYSTGAVPSNAGGFACDADPPDLSNDYWDTTTSGTTYTECYEVEVQGAIGLTTKQLQNKLPRGFSRKIWAENSKINNGLPYLINNLPQK